MKKLIPFILLFFCSSAFATTSNFYSSTADGDIWQLDTTWDLTHDAPASTQALEVTQQVIVCATGKAGSNYDCERCFIMFDTSALPDNAIITSATLNLKGTVTNSHNSQGNPQDYAVMVQTTQATTTSLVQDDFDQCGAIDSPTEGSNHFLISNWNDTAYNVMTLNSTGLGWISKTGYTKLGVRLGYDVEDVENATPPTSSVTFASTEVSGTSSDPYLSVTYYVPGTQSTGASLTGGSLN